MDAYLLSTIALVGLMALGVLAVITLPAWIAWLVAWRSGMPRRQRRSFSLTCLLLAYGVMTLAGALLMPLGLAQVFIAPELHTAGYEQVATAIFVTAEHGVPGVCLLTVLIAAVLIPVKLSRHWLAVTDAMTAEAFVPARQSDAG